MYVLEICLLLSFEEKTIIIIEMSYLCGYFTSLKPGCAEENEMLLKKSLTAGMRMISHFVY